MPGETVRTGGAAGLLGWLGALGGAGGMGCNDLVGATGRADVDRVWAAGVVRGTTVAEGVDSRRTGGADDNVVAGTELGAVELGRAALRTVALDDPALGNPAVGNPAVGDWAVGDWAVGDWAVGDWAVGNPALVRWALGPAEPDLGAAEIGVGEFVACAERAAVDRSVALGAPATAAEDPLPSPEAVEPPAPDGAERVALDVHPVSSSATTIHWRPCFRRTPSRAGPLVRWPSRIGSVDP